MLLIAILRGFALHPDFEFQFLVSRLHEIHCTFWRQILRSMGEFLCALNSVTWGSNRRSFSSELKYFADKAENSIPAKNLVMYQVLDKWRKIRKKKRIKVFHLEKFYKNNHKVYSAATCHFWIKLNCLVLRFKIQGLFSIQRFSVSNLKN